MLIQRKGSYCGDISIQLSVHSKKDGSGFAVIGDKEFRILLNEGEIRELHRLLGQFVSETKIKERLSGRDGCGPCAALRELAEKVNGKRKKFSWRNWGSSRT